MRSREKTPIENCSGLIPNGPVGNVIVCIVCLLSLLYSSSLEKNDSVATQIEYQNYNSVLHNKTQVVALDSLLEYLPMNWMLLPAKTRKSNSANDDGDDDDDDETGFSSVAVHHTREANHLIFLIRCWKPAPFRVLMESYDSTR